MGILIGVFCVVIFMDWRCYRIPNACIVTGMAAGLITTFLSCSVSGLLEAVSVSALVFVTLYPFYLLGTLGAGDVKLFMMVGCYRPYMAAERFLQYLLVTMILAAAISIVKMIAYTESRNRLLYLARYLRKAALTGAIDEYQIDKTQKHCVVRLSIPAFLSLLLMCIGAF